MKTTVNPLLIVLLCVASSTLISGCSYTETEFEVERRQKEELIRRQEEEKARQKREADDIKRQRFWNDELKRYE